MDRREFLSSSTTLGVASIVGGLSSGAFAHEKGVTPTDLLITNKETLKLVKNVSKTAADCVRTGNACIQHCNEELIGGEVENFDRCVVTASQMAVLCEAVLKLSAQKAKRVKDILQACIDACKACKEACEKHKGHFGHGHHLECKECMDACAACEVSCTALLKAL